MGVQKIVCSGPAKPLRYCLSFVCLFWIWTHVSSIIPIPTLKCYFFLPKCRFSIYNCFRFQTSVSSCPYLQEKWDEQGCLTLLVWNIYSYTGEIWFIIIWFIIKISFVLVLWLKKNPNLLSAGDLILLFNFMWNQSPWKARFLLQQTIVIMNKPQKCRDICASSGAWAASQWCVTSKSGSCPWHWFCPLLLNIITASISVGSNS